MNYFGGFNNSCGCSSGSSQFMPFSNSSYGCCQYCGNNNNSSYYAIILVLFILLVIVIGSRQNN